MPSYLNLDTKSQWQTSALQMAALESVTLPSRLRLGDPSRAPLADIEAVFTNEANRRILELGLSAKVPQAVNGQVNGATHDHRIQTNGDVMDIDRADEPHADKNIDIDLFRLGDALSSSRRSSQRQLQPHTFAQIHVQRGTWPAPFAIPDIELDTPDLNRRNFTTSHLFPVLSSYPRIFQFDSEKLPVHVELASTSAVANRLRALADVTRGLIGIEDRETTGAEIRALAEEYVEGWESADEGSDDE
jgi:hypothetical protein